METPSMFSRRYLRRWIALSLWVLVQIVLHLRPGVQPLDFLTYRIAADELIADHTPYQTVVESQNYWRNMHRTEALLRPDQIPDLSDIAPDHPGPYLYPPTLASIVAWLNLSPMVFLLLMLGAVVGFIVLWFAVTKQTPIWMFLFTGSWDVIASVYFVNVEVSLLFLTLLTAWMLWKRWWVAAAPLIALVLLIKPFYAFFYLAYGLLLLRKSRHMWWPLIGAALGASLIIGVEYTRWDTTLHAQTWQYLTQALDYQWFGFPISEQTPMSNWNRTPIQIFSTLGLAPTQAQVAALLVWFVALGATLLIVKPQALTFPVLFALSLLLLYWGRQITWQTLFLEPVVFLTLRPLLNREQQRFALWGVIAFIASHWLALALTLRGFGMPMQTLQTATFPFETLLVLPAVWVLLLYFHLPRTALQRITIGSSEESASR